MNILLKSILIGLVISVIAYFSVEQLKTVKPVTTFRAEYTVEITPDTVESKRFSFAQVREEIRNRLKASEIEYELLTMNDRVLKVNMSHLKDTSFSSSIITANGRLQFWELYSLSELQKMIEAAWYTLLPKVPNPEPVKKDTSKPSTGKLSEEIVITDGPVKKTETLFEVSQGYDYDNGLRYPAEIGTVKIKDTGKLRSLFEKEDIAKLKPSDAILCFGERLKSRKGTDSDDLKFYFIKTYGRFSQAILENEDVAHAEPSYSANGQMEVQFRFNREGSRKWKSMTERNINKCIAIMLTGKIISAPFVVSVIEDGNCSISGGYTSTEIQWLSQAIKSTRLPAKMEIISSRFIPERSNKELHRKLIVCIAAFLVSGALSFFIFKTLSSSGTGPITGHENFDKRP